METEKGQNLLELTIGLGLIAVVVAAVAISNLNGLKNSQFSQNQLQATKLAQEGIDIIRSIKERDYTVCISGNIRKWKNDDMWNQDCHSTSICSMSLKFTGTCGAAVVSDPYWLNNSSPTYESLNYNNLIFKREISINDRNIQGTWVLNEKEITVIVSWTDISGMHESKVSTILTQ